jgi:DNA-binding cell septation regulator SpoVG
MQDRISEIEITPIKPRNGLVGFASLVFDNAIYLGSIGIFTRPQGGYRLTYPMRKNENTEFNVFHPINRVAAEEIEQAIIKKFEEVNSINL